MFRTLFLVSALLIGPSVSAQKTGFDVFRSQDMILYGGDIYTGNPSQPRAEAIAIKGKRITAVGSNDDILAMAGPKTRLVDLQGHLMIPGINDAHNHAGVLPAHHVLEIPTFAPAPGPSVSEVMVMLAEKVKSVPTGEWIFGTVGSNFLTDPTAIRLTIDAVAPDHPVMLSNWVGHGRVLNTPALTAAGIALDAENPPGGFYGRLEDGTISGMLNEYTEHHLARFFKSMVSPQDSAAQYLAFAQSKAAQGITSMQTMDIGYDRNSIESILAQLELPVHWRTICFPVTPDEACRSTLRDRFLKNSNALFRVNATGIKFMMDGTPVEGFAALREPYTSLPGWTGVFNFEGSFREILLRILEGDAKANQLILHCVGDRTIDIVLDEMELLAPAEVWRERRVRIEHGILLWPEQLARMADLGVVLVTNPVFIGMGAALQAEFGPERSTRLLPLAEILDAGVHLAFATDINASTPFIDMFLALINSANPGQGISLEHSLAAYTMGGAYAEFAEDVKGSLEPGKYADLAVLNINIFSTLPTQLANTASILTMVAGSISHDTGVLVIE